MISYSFVIITISIKKKLYTCSSNKQKTIRFFIHLLLLLFQYIKNIHVHQNTLYVFNYNILYISLFKKINIFIYVFSSFEHIFLY